MKILFKSYNFVFKNKVMQTITIKINERSKAGIALQKMLEILKTQPGVEVVNEDRSPYNSEFVKKIKKSEQQIKEGKYKVVDTKDIWGSLEL